MTYNTTVSLDKLTQDKFDRCCSSKKDSDYLDVKLKVFKKDDNRDFRLVQNLMIREIDFSQFMRLRNRLVIAAENFGREENLSPVLIPKTFEDMDEQFKLVHKVVDVVDRPYKKICVTLLRYNVDKPESSYAQVRLFLREKFPQTVYENYKLEEIIYSVDLMNSAYDKVNTNKPICIVP